jgi:hypothetical protein
MSSQEQVAWRQSQNRKLQCVCQGKTCRCYVEPICPTLGHAYPPGQGIEWGLAKVLSKMPRSGCLGKRVNTDEGWRKLSEDVNGICEPSEICGHGSMSFLSFNRVLRGMTFAPSAHSGLMC